MQQMTAKLLETKMFRGTRSVSRSSNRDDSTSEETQMVSTPLTEPVGYLDIEVVGAEGLTAADFSGKSDPYVVLEMDGHTYRTNTVYHTLSPKWKEQMIQFPIIDISSILYVTVYDEDRFGEPEFLGKIGLPVVTFRNETSVNRIVQLRDKSLRQATKGTIELIVHKKWDPLKVALRTISPHKRADNNSEVFKTSTFVRNVQRVRGIMADVMAAAKYVETCFEWTYPSRSIKAFVFFVLVTYYFELYMLPLAIIAFIFLYPGWKKEFRNENGSQVIGDVMSEMEVEGEAEMDVADSNCDDSDDVRGLSGRLKALQSVTVFVQDSVGFVASSVESVWTLLEFRVPFLSWLFVAFLSLASIILYLIPLRWIVMIWGVNKFSKKLRNPNYVPSSELLNFLSRVPDGPTLEKCFVEMKMESKKDVKRTISPTFTRNATATTIHATLSASSSSLHQRISARKTSFLQTKFAKKLSKPDL